MDEHGRKARSAPRAPFARRSPGWLLWFDAIRALEAQGTWRREDVALLAQYCRAVLTADEARRALDKEGLTTQTADGRAVAHPLVRVAREAEADARAAATALLLTPASRRRAGVDAVPDAVPDWMPGVA
ncbi:MAG: phage terminase small subunit P27 family [Thermoleophilaceae bacterium]|nr:phage terminase small subunit P27 family [Thermoleophilaceae bacterium]